MKSGDYTQNLPGHADKFPQLELPRQDRINELLMSLPLDVRTRVAIDWLQGKL